MNPKSNRRTFLRAVGAGLATLPFFRLVEDSYAQSTGAALPQRFIGVYHPHGIAAELFTMRDTDTETSFNLTYAESPLQPFDDPGTYGKSFKDKIVVIEGIDLLSEANGHDSAGTILTGSRVSGNLPQNSSLDQFLAVEKGLGKSTRVTSVALAVGNKELKAGETLSFGAGGAPISKIIDPVLAFDLLFKGAVVGDDPAAQAEAERQRKLGLSLIDFVNGDVKRLRARVAPREQQKLDQHLDALREIEKQFQIVSGPGGGGAGGCSAPTRPTAFPKLERYNGGEPYFDAITNMHIDLLALAMGCDITRFATLVLNDLSYASNPLGLPEDNHGGVAHTYNSSPIGSSGNPVGDGNPATWQLLGKFNKYSYGKIARLLQKLDQAGVLDSTLVYASSDMGNPAGHSTRNAPTVLAGGANGKIRMGRRLKFRTDCPIGTWCSTTGPEYQTVPNNRLLVSIAQAFGVEIDSYGTQSEEKFKTGALTEL
jgi:hypothetical protein